jgi:predicted DNA-binding transcriptional regulator YafY
MIKLELTAEELQALAGLMDMGCKAGGLSVVKQAASLLTKLEAAVAEANKQPTSQETE